MLNVHSQRSTFARGCFGLWLIVFGGCAVTGDSGKRSLHAEVANQSGEQNVNLGSDHEIELKETATDAAFAQLCSIRNDWNTGLPESGPARTPGGFPGGFAKLSHSATMPVVHYPDIGTIRHDDGWSAELTIGDL